MVQYYLYFIMIDTLPELKRALTLSFRKTRFGDFPDPIAQDILQSKAFLILAKEIKGLNLPYLEPLAGGTFHIVLDAGDCVLRLGFGSITYRPLINEVLQPLSSGMVGNLKYELMPKAQTHTITEEHLAVILKSLEEKGYLWSDAGLDNIGIYQGKPVIIDSEGISPILHKYKVNRPK